MFVPARLSTTHTARTIGLARLTTIRRTIEIASLASYLLASETP